MIISMKFFIEVLEDQPGESIKHESINLIVNFNSLPKSHSEVREKFAMAQPQYARAKSGGTPDELRLTNKNDAASDRI